MDLTFTPAVMIRRDNFGHIGDSYIYRDELSTLALLALDTHGVEYDEDPDGRLLIGVPAGHDTVFTVGPYTIVLDR